MYEKAVYLYEAIIVYLLNVDKRIDDHYQKHLEHYLHENNITKFLELNNLTYENFTMLKESDRPTWVYPSNKSEIFPVINYTLINSTFSAKNALYNTFEMFESVVNTTINS